MFLGRDPTGRRFLAEKGGSPFSAEEAECSEARGLLSVGSGGSALGFRSSGFGFTSGGDCGGGGDLGSDGGSSVGGASTASSATVCE